MIRNANIVQSLIHIFLKLQYVVIIHRRKRVL